MPNGQLNLKLPARVRRFIERQVASGAFARPDDVVTAALLQYESEAKFIQSLPKERLEELLEEGERSLKNERPVPMEEAFAELRRRSAARRRPRRVA